MTARLAGPAVAMLALILGEGAALAQSPMPQPSGDVAPSGPVTSVVGTEYAFSGLPDNVPAGTTFAFENQGAELHQFLVVRKKEGVTESWDELLALPEAEANSKVTFIGDLIAGPGKTSPSTFAITEPGDYFAVCFIPQGATHDPTVSFDPMAAPDASMVAPSGEPVGGTPHAFLGMRQEYTVTPAG
jgi:hypothetical protein